MSSGAVLRGGCFWQAGYFELSALIGFRASLCSPMCWGLCGLFGVRVGNCVSLLSLPGPQQGQFRELTSSASGASLHIFILISQSGRLVLTTEPHLAACPDGCWGPHSAWSWNTGTPISKLIF